MEVRHDGCDAYLALPNGQARRGILVLHEAFGLTDDIRRISDRLSAHGYVAVAPALLRGGCLMRTLRSATRTQMLDRWRRYLRSEHGVARDALIGFCLGGGFALAYAAAGPEEPLGAVAGNYGSVPPDLSRVCPVVASYGAKDRRLAPQAERLERELDRLGVAHDVKVYPGAGHGFMNQHEGGLANLMARLGPLDFHEESAVDAWARIFSFLEAHLGPA